MTTRYFLPCRCGNNLTVEMSQAGQILACSCGESTEIPRMSELRTLEPTADWVDQQATSQSRWTWFRGLLFVTGTVIAVVALFVLVNLFIFRPKLVGAGPSAVTETIVREDLADLDPEESWLEWKTLRNAHVHRPHNIFGSEPIDPRTQTDRYMTIAACIFVAGSGMVGSALLIRGI